MLLIVIAALCIALVVQQERASRRERQLQDRLEMSIARYLDNSIEKEPEPRPDTLLPHHLPTKSPRSSP